MKFGVFCVCDVLPENFIFLFDLNEFPWFLGCGEYVRVDKKKDNECDHLLYTNINLLYSSEIGLPVKPSHISNLNPNSSK